MFEGYARGQSVSSEVPIEELKTVSILDVSREYSLVYELITSELRVLYYILLTTSICIGFRPYNDAM